MTSRALFFSRIFWRIWSRVALVDVVLVITCSSPVYAQLNFTGFGISGPTDPIVFVAGLGTGAFPLTPSNGVGPFLFEYDPGGALIPGFRVMNWPDVPNFFPSGARGGLIGLALAADIGTHSTMVRMTDLGTNQQITKQVDLQISEVDVGISAGPGVFPLSGAGVGDSVQIPVWALGGTPPYSFSLVTANLPPGGINALPSGLSLQTTDPNAGLAWISGNIDMAASGGPYQFGIQVTAGNLRTFRRVFTNIFISGLHLNSFPGVPERFLPFANLNQYFSQTLTATGCSGPCSFSLVEGDTLPMGLSMSAMGDITGTPTQLTYGRDFTVVVNDGAGQFIRRRLVIMVLPTVLQPLVISGPTSVGDFAAGTSRAWWFYARGGQPPYDFSLDAGSVLPQGAYPNILPAAALGPEGDPQVGVLHSRALVPGDHRFVLKVMDSGGSTATLPLSLKITDIGTFYCCLPQGSNIPTLLSEYRQPTFPVGGTPPYSVTPVNIVSGLSINNEGVVSGRPLVAGQSNQFDFQLTDSSIPPKTYFNDGGIRVNNFVPMTDGVLGTPGGTVNDPITGGSVQFPPGALPGNVEVAIDVLPTAPNLATPIGFSAGTLFTNIQLSPTPPMPFPPGVNLVLPLPAPGLSLGTPIQLFRLDPGTGLLVTAFDTNGAPLVGAVLAGGLTASFQNVARLSTVVGFRPADVTPPMLSVKLSPSQIWPPNHRLAPVTAMISVSDDFDASPRVELVAIVSSEPDDGLGDGDTLNDIQGAVIGTDDRSFLLRAERSGRGAGRVYTVTYRATDASGNATTVSEHVVVLRKPTLSR